MRSLPFFRFAIVVVGAAVAASCGDTSAPDINPVDYLLAEANGSWSASAASYMALSTTPSSPTFVSANSCVYNATTKLFKCPQSSAAGLTFDLSYQILDGANAPLPAYDAKSVAAIRTVTDLAGTLAGSSSAITVTSHGDRTMTGVLGGTPTVNGTESASFVRAGALISSNTYTETTISNFTMAPRNSPTPYPSGVVASKYYFGPPAPGNAPYGVFTMTFNGSQMATMVWNFSGSVQTCTFDLKGIAQPVCTTP